MIKLSKYKLPIVFLLWIVLLVTGVSISPRFLLQTPFVGDKNSFGDGLPRLVWVWANLDGGHYLSIARNGYFESQQGFFPLYPFLIRTVATVTHIKYVPAALLVTYACFFGFLCVFYKLLRLDFSEKRSRNVLIALLCFPTAFYLISVYNDSLFLLIVTSSFFLARRKSWFLAGMLGFLAALVRITGLALFPALFLEWMISDRKKTYGAFTPFLVPLGTLSFFLYLESRFDSWTTFLTSMSIWGQHEYVFPLQTAWRYMKMFYSVSPLSLDFIRAMLELGAVIFSLLLLFRFWHKLRISYLVYTLSLLVIPLSSGTFQGMSRYIIHAFPLVILVTLYLQKKRLTPMVIGASMIAQLLSIIFFSQGYFVA